MLKSVVLVFSVLVLSICLGFTIEPQEERNLRIIGGQNAEDGQFPYQVSLRSSVDDSESWGHWCGGSIINSKWILTAGHCVYDISDPSLYHVLTGSVLLSSGGVQRAISKIVTHEAFNISAPFIDIALVELVDEIEFSDDVQPIELETEDIGIVDCVVSGWGRLHDGGSIPDNLQFINLKTISLQDCQVVYLNTVTQNQICTLTREGEGMCWGDSGSALVADGKQIGIVSRGVPCGYGYPDIYTKVSEFISWIEENINA